MKKYILSISIIVMMFIVAACGSDDKKESDKKYDKKEAVASDSTTCDTLKNLFNASMTDEDAYNEIIRASDSISIYFENGEMKFETKGFSAVEKQLKSSFSKGQEPKEKGKNGYRISWDVTDRKVSNIKVVTIE